VSENDRSHFTDTANSQFKMQKKNSLKLKLEQLKDEKTAENSKKRCRHDVTL